MAQHSGVIVDQAGLAFLADLNNALMADKTLNSGAAEPATKYAGMFWLDTSGATPVLKQRNQANDGWNTLSSLLDAEMLPSPTASGFVLRNAANDGNETKTAQQAAAILSPFLSLGKNAVINGNFSINQRGKSGTVTLGAGVYGHDRWKAGASGCTYTFATVENVTTLTITAGSLRQVIEGANLQSDTYTLSWQGTAQGKIDTGTYSASGVTGTATGGTNLTIEFGTGTLSLVQLERGSVVTPFERVPLADEVYRCRRYFRHVSVSARFPAGAVGEATTVPVSFDIMRQTPAATILENGAVSIATATVSINKAYGGRFEITSTATGDCHVLLRVYELDAEL